MNEKSTFNNVDNDELKCPSCGSNEVTTREVEDTFTYGIQAEAVSITALLPIRSCSRCGFEFLDAEAEAAQHDAVCRYLRVMTPGEIRALRVGYALSRAEFARITRLGEATVGRWERGALIQNAAYDQLLYLLTFAENLQRLQGRGASPSVSESSPTALRVLPRFQSIEPTETDLDLAVSWKLRSDAA